MNPYRAGSHTLFGVDSPYASVQRYYGGTGGATDGELGIIHQLDAPNISFWLDDVPTTNPFK